MKIMISRINDDKTIDVLSVHEHGQISVPPTKTTLKADDPISTIAAKADAVVAAATAAKEA